MYGINLKNLLYMAFCKLFNLAISIWDIVMLIYVIMSLMASSVLGFLTIFWD